MKKSDRQIIFDKYDGHCAYCGSPLNTKEMQVDHIIPKCNFLSHIKNKYKVPLFLTHLTEDDVNHIDNLMPTCRVCNKWKSAHSLELFRSELFEQVKRLNDYSSNYRIAKRYGLVKEEIKPIIFYFEKVNNPLN
jgi:5-methylcytosine-specific restriction endonuclease McrA